MTPGELLTDAFNRIREDGEEVVDGLSAEQLGHRPSPHANSIAWLVWHLTRIQDDHVADVAGLEQVWTGAGWHERFGLPFAPRDTGYGHRPDDVAQLEGVAADQLVGYLDAVNEQTLRYVADLTETDLDRIVDTRWDPPVTLGVRLVSVVNDDNQHIGQAAYLRGLIEG
jgi:uncharacterized damage-inducible protein DinB